MASGRTLVHRRNCVGCHVIEGAGGDFIKLVAEPSLGPPLLTPEGARVQPDWLYAFLRGPITIRPWLDVRMPTFGLDDHNLNGVIQYFGAVSNTIGPFQTHEMVRTASATAGGGTGKELFELLKCQQCHVLGAIPKDQPTANLAPDLRMSPERLNPDWILDWLKTAVGHPARHANAGVLARLSEVVLPAAGRRRRGADPRDSRPPDDVPRWTESESERREDGEQQLGQVGQMGRVGQVGPYPPNLVSPA